MDIVSRLPVEIAHQVLSNLDIQDVAACQQVSRQWYWIAIDPLVWKSVFLEREKTFAIPTGSYPFPTKGKGVIQQSSATQSTLATPATTSDSSNSSSSPFSSSSSFSSLSSVSFSGLKSRLTGAITTATSTTTSASTTSASTTSASTTSASTTSASTTSASTTPPPAAQSAATANETTRTTNATLNTDNSMIMSTMRDRDWKKECRTRIMTDRNWARGHIQAVFTLKLHKGAIARLRIKSGKMLSADMFGQVAVWDTTTYKCDGVIEAAVGPIQLLDFSIAAMVMTVISKSGVCRIWDIKSKRLMHSSTATYVTCMTMNDEHLIMGSKGGEIQVIDFMTGQIVASTNSFPGETLQDIYIQNNTLIIATDHHIRIVSIDTLELLLTSPLPIPPTTHAYCCVFHIRSLILLTDEHLLHIEWEPLYSHKDDRLLTDTQFELPPNLTKAPLIHRTKIPPILTITSIAIGGKHPHVLTTNADRPSLNDAIRVCPVIPRHHFYGNPGNELVEASRSRSRSRRSQPIRRDDVPRMPLEDDDEEEEEEEVEDDELDLGLDGSEAEGIVLTSQVDAINDYLEGCGLKPSFMDVDEDVIVVGTSKGDIVVLHMMPQD